MDVLVSTFGEYRPTPFPEGDASYQPRVGTPCLPWASFGASGSGTTTLGRLLAGRLGSMHLDTDHYYWCPTDPPFQQPREIPDRQRLLGSALAAESGWVLSGSLCGWGDIFIPGFDLVVFLWVPPEVRLARLRERERGRYGADAIAPGGALHSSYIEFMDWAAAYDDGDVGMRSFRRHDQWLRELPSPVIRLGGTQPVEESLGRVVAYLSRLTKPK